MMWVSGEFCEKLFCRNADLVEIAAITKLYAAGHHVNIESLHVVVRYVRGRIGNDREATRIVVTADILPVHVVRFLGAQVAEVAANTEYFLGLVDMNMDFRFALRAGEYQRVA